MQQAFVRFKLPPASQLRKCRQQVRLAHSNFSRPLPPVKGIGTEQLIQYLYKPDLRRRLIDAVHIDRLNLGPVPTIQLNWLQPHEGNIVEFLFRARAFQTA